jgi:hypothetical protein
LKAMTSVKTKGGAPCGVFTVTLTTHVPAIPWFAACPWELGIKTSSDTATQTATKYSPSLRMFILLVLRSPQPWQADA